MSWRPARRRLRTVRSSTSPPMRVSAIAFSVIRASSSPNEFRPTTSSIALAVRASASS